MAKLSELTIDLSIGNIEETITELKRVQREAKKATQAVAEFASVLDVRKDAVPSLLSAVSTEDLVIALLDRGAVSADNGEDFINLRVPGVRWSPIGGVIE